MNSRSRSVPVIILLLLLAGFLALPAPVRSSAPVAAAAPAAERPPNVVFILVDDLGWTDLGSFGSRYYETPHIDRLARQGMKFTNAYAACAVCSPTRASVLTGRYPARIGITDWIRARFQGGAIPADGKNPSGWVTRGNRPLVCPENPLWLEHEEVTIAEALAPAGYVSCHIGKWHLGPDDYYPERQGFDRNLGGCDFGQPPSYFDPYERGKQGRIPTLEPRKKGEYLTDREADEAVRFLREARDRPFFLYLAHYAVHTPLMGKKDLVARYREKPPTSQKNPVYAAMVQSVDEAAGKVLAALDELGLAKRTLVFFTSDNGGLLGPTHNAPLRAGKGWPYEGGIRVPLIARWPGVIPAGSVSDTPVSSIDYLPTILEAVGQPLPRGRVIDGVSLLAHLKSGGKSSIERDALYWHFPHYRSKRITPYSVIRAGEWKLVRWYEGNRQELYHLGGDLGETRDLSGKLPAKVDELSGRLDRWLASVGAKVPRPRAKEK